MRLQKQLPTNTSHRNCDVLFVVTHLSPGGTREMIALIADELRTHGLDVDVAALYRGKNADLREFACDIIIDRERLSGFGYVKAFIRLTRHVRALRPRAILSFMPAANIVGTLSAWVIGIHRRIATHHQPGWTQHPVLRILDWTWGSIGMYNQIIAISHSIQSSFADYPHWYLERIRVIPNAIKSISPRSGSASVREQFGLSADAILIVVIGRLSQEKNLFNTLAGAASAAGIQIALVGDGPLRGEIERYIAAAHLENKVFLLGHVDRQVATDILFAADVFLQLSSFEGRSLALLEAVYAEKAIVVSDIPSQREVLSLCDGSVAGLVCDPNNVNLIAAAISAVSSNERLRRELAAKTRSLKRSFDSTKMGREYVEVLTGSSTVVVKYAQS